jgi:hypothetical protein
MLGDQVGVDEKSDELVPREAACRRREVGEIKGETAGDQMNRVARRWGGWRWHITSVGVQNGYIRIPATRKQLTFARVQSEIGSKGKEKAAAKCDS